jgi:serine/threonine protein kinase
MSGLSDAALTHLGMIAEVPDLSHTKYELIQYLAHGGMGAVYMARDRELDRDVALKVLGPTTDTVDLARRLVAEARILARLEHPGIVPVHDVGSLPDGRMFYTMKLIRGRRLDDASIRSATLSERLQIFERICDATAFAHANQVIHRDLKPTNVMVGAFGEVLVLDWGVAKITVAPEPSSASAVAALPVTGDTAAGALVGTPGFIAPERAAGAPADERSDVYSLGAILAFLLGRDVSPVDAPAPRAIENGVPRPLLAIMQAALIENPAARYQNVAQFAAELARFREGYAVEAYREGVLERWSRHARRYRVPIALVVAYLIMRLLLLGLRRT